MYWILYKRTNNFKKVWSYRNKGSIIRDISEKNN